MQPGSTEKLTLDWSLYVIAPVGVDIDTLGGMFKNDLLDILTAPDPDTGTSTPFTADDIEFQA